MLEEDDLECQMVDRWECHGPSTISLGLQVVSKSSSSHPPKVKLPCLGHQYHGLLLGWHGKDAVLRQVCGQPRWNVCCPHLRRLSQHGPQSGPLKKRRGLQLKAQRAFNVELVFQGLSPASNCGNFTSLFWMGSIHSGRCSVCVCVCVCLLTEGRMVALYRCTCYRWCDGS